MLTTLLTVAIKSSCLNELIADDYQALQYKGNSTSFMMDWTKTKKQVVKFFSLSDIC